eukprot:6129370-Pleurochrysis_carterae.AAC.2
MHATHIEYKCEVRKARLCELALWSTGAIVATIVASFSICGASACRPTCLGIQLLQWKQERQSCESKAHPKLYRSRIEESSDELRLDMWMEHFRRHCASMRARQPTRTDIVHQ